MIPSLTSYTAVQTKLMPAICNVVVSTVFKGLLTGKTAKSFSEIPLHTMLCNSIFTVPIILTFTFVVKLPTGITSSERISFNGAHFEFEL